MASARGATAAAVRDQDRRLVACVQHLQRLLRARSENPPGDEHEAAAYVVECLRIAGVPATVVEPAPRRTSVIGRLRSDGSAGGPLLLMGHLDVVPADPADWTIDPFGGHVRDGQVYGRGAVDMKSMIAMELQVFLELAERASAAGLDPAVDAVPGLGRDLILAATADEETGGALGMGWIAANDPELIRADAALNEAGGFSVDVAGARVYPIQVAEKGKVVVRLTVRGRAGHGSMPHPENAAVLAARIVDRVAVPLPVSRSAPVLGVLDTVRASLPLPVTREGRNGAIADPAVSLALAALLRDTMSPNVVHAGVKYNVIPGTAVVEIDCRVLPGTTDGALLARLRSSIGDELWNACQAEIIARGESVSSPPEHPLVDIMTTVVGESDPAAIAVTCMAPFATDAKHTVPLGIPTYGFSPLRLGLGESFLRWFHATDERVPIDALAWGLPVLREVVRRYCVSVHDDRGWN